MHFSLIKHLANLIIIDASPFGLFFCGLPGQESILGCWDKITASYHLTDHPDIWAFLKLKISYRWISPLWHYFIAFVTLHQYVCDARSIRKWRYVITLCKNRENGRKMKNWEKQGKRKAECGLAALCIFPEWSFAKHIFPIFIYPFFKLLGILA